MWVACRFLAWSRLLAQNTSRVIYIYTYHCQFSWTSLNRCALQRNVDISIVSLSLSSSPCDSIRLELTYHSSMILSSDPSYLSVCHHLCTSKSLPCSRSHTFRLKELVRLEYGDGKAKSFPLVSSPKLITHEYDRSRLALLCSARHVEKSIIFRGFHTRIMILSLSKMIYLPEWSLSHDFTTSCQQSPR